MAPKKLANGTYQVRWREPDGRHRGKRFQRKADAVAFEAKIRLDLNRGDYVPSALGEQTITEIAQQWLEASPHLAPGTIDTYRRDLDRYILPSLGVVQLRRLSPEQIQAFINGEMSRLASSSVHRHYRTLNTLLNWAVRMRYLGSNPCDVVKAPRVVKSEEQHLEVEQVEALADAINPRYRCFILLAAYGGLRWSELVGLRRSAIDGAKVTVLEQLKRRDSEWQRGPTKTATSRRTVILPPSIAEELETHLATYSEPGADGLVFVNQHGNPIGDGWRGNVWAPTCAKVGLAQREHRPGKKPAYRGAPKFHSLRHTHAALAIATGAHPKMIQDRLGHSTIAVTMNTYGHLLQGADQGLALDLDNLRSVSRG